MFGPSKATGAESVDAATARPGTTQTARAQAVSGLVYPLCVAAIVSFGLVSLWPSLFRTWFFNSDEYVVAAEVIRFVGLDFRQEFVDMPGTPMMALAAVVWFLYFVAQSALGLFSMARGISAFTFEHISALFVLLRGITLFSFALSLVLLYRLASRVMNRAGAATAALIFGMSAVYAQISSLVRVEPLALCFMLSGLLLLVRALDAPLSERRSFVRFDLFFLAGLLAGLAAATRLHSIIASVPVFVLLTVFSEPRTASSSYERSVRVFGLLALVISAGMAALVMTKWHPVFAEVPHAYSLIRAALVGGTALLSLITACYAVKATRPWVIRLVSPDLIRMLLGCGAGLLIGAATIPRQYAFFLRSMENYDASYRDVTRLDWPFMKNAAWYLSHYLEVIAPDRVLLFLLIVGIILVIVRHERRLVAFLLGAILFFVSKPLTLIPAPHHVIPWMPFFAIVLAYPVAKLDDLVEHLWPGKVLLRSSAFLVCVAALWWKMTPGPIVAANALPDAEERLVNVESARSWIKENAESNANVAISYYCFNPDTFYAWLRFLNVPVPDSMFDGRTYMIWWGNQSALKGLAGYMCVSPQDVALKDIVERRTPGEGTDPSIDSRFRLLRSFGRRENVIQVYHFDYREASPDQPRVVQRADSGSQVPARGIAVRAATYGQSCSGTALPHGATNQVRPGNATRLVENACEGQDACDVEIAAALLGDPAPYCAKDFRVEWTCPDGRTYELTMPPEAASAVVHLQCAAAESR